MKVNTVDIRKFNAKQLTVDLKPPAVAVNSEWVEGAPTPQEFRTEVQYGTLKVTILFRGSGRNEIVRDVSEFMSLLTRRSELQLDGYKGTYIGDMTSNSLDKTKEATRYILTLQFKGYMADAEVVNVYESADRIKFTTLGTRDAPCIIEVLPRASMAQYTISGFGENDIVLSNLTEGRAVVIDGEKGIVTEGGANKFADCDIWEFPILKTGRENAVEFSPSRCDVTVRYRPMWL